MKTFESPINKTANTPSVEFPQATEDTSGVRERLNTESVSIEELTQPHQELISRIDAYRAFAARMNHINGALEQIIASKQKGGGATQQRAELIKEAERLNAWIQQVGLEETQDHMSGTQGDATMLVENPFYRSDAILDKGEAANDQIPPETPVHSEHHEQRSYNELVARSMEISTSIRKFEEVENMIIGMISAMHEGTSAMREELARKQQEDPIDALASLLGKTFSQEKQSIQRMEDMLRSRAQEAGYPDMLNVIGESIEKLATEKKQVLTNIASIDQRAEEPIPLVRRKEEENEPIPLIKRKQGSKESDIQEAA